MPPATTGTVDFHWSRFQFSQDGCDDADRLLFNWIWSSRCISSDICFSSISVADIDNSKVHHTLERSIAQPLLCCSTEYLLYHLRSPNERFLSLHHALQCFFLAHVDLSDVNSLGCDTTIEGARICAVVWDRFLGLVRKITNAPIDLVMGTLSYNSYASSRFNMLCFFFSTDDTPLLASCEHPSSRSHALRFGLDLCKVSIVRDIVFE